MPQSKGICFICQDAGGSQIQCCTCKMVYVHSKCLGEYISKNENNNKNEAIYDCPHCHTKYKNLGITRTYHLSSTKCTRFLRDMLTGVAIVVLGIFQIIVWLMSIIYVCSVIAMIIFLPWAMNRYRMEHLANIHQEVEWERNAFIVYISLFIPYYIVNLLIHWSIISDIDPSIYALKDIHFWKFHKSEYEQFWKFHKYEYESESMNKISKKFNGAFTYCLRRSAFISYILKEGGFIVSLYDVADQIINFIRSAISEEYLIVSGAVAPIYFCFITDHENTKLNLLIPIIIGWSGIGIHFVLNYLPWIMVGSCYGLILILIFIKESCLELCLYCKEKCMKCCLYYCIDAEESYTTNNAVRAEDV